MSNDYAPIVTVGGVDVSDSVISFQIEVGRRGANDSFDVPNATIRFNGQPSFSQIDDVTIDAVSPTQTDGRRFTGVITDIEVGIYDTTVTAISATWGYLNVTVPSYIAPNNYGPLTNEFIQDLMEYPTTFIAGFPAEFPGWVEPVVFKRSNLTFEYEAKTVDSWAWGYPAGTPTYTIATWYDKVAQAFPDMIWYIDEEDQVNYELPGYRANPTVTLDPSWIERAITSDASMNDRANYTGVNQQNGLEAAAVFSSVARFRYFAQTQYFDTPWNNLFTGTGPALAQWYVTHVQAQRDLDENTRLSAMVVPVQHLSTADAETIFVDLNISTVCDSSQISSYLPVAGDLVVEGWTETYGDDGYWSVAFNMSFANVSRARQRWTDVGASETWDDVPNTLTWAGMETGWIN